jgi:cytochrome c oxidase subunit 2
MRKKNRTLSLAALLFLFLICNGVELKGQSQTSEPPIEIKITAKRFEFDPATITLPKGKPVRLLITSVDVQHGFSIKELGISRDLKANETTIVEFTPTRAGHFQFHCSVYCGAGHEEMTGELIVTDEQTNASGKMQVKFVDDAPGVVIVEANGEKLRIDTRTRTVAQLNETETPAPAPSPQTVAETPEHTHQPELEPYDYRLVNVPTPKRVLKGSVNLYFTHRFSEPLRPISQSGKDLFGLDSFAVSSLGVFYGVTDRLYVSAYRSPICQRGLCRTIEFGVGYHLLDERGRSPLALSSYASVEGDDNFRENYTYNLQLMLARSVTKYVHVFFSPAVHLNANGQRRFNPRPQDFFPQEPLANQFRLAKHGGSFGFGANARIRPSISLLFEYTPRVGFKLGRVVPVFAPGTGRITGFDNESEAEVGFGVEKDIGRHTFSLTFTNTQTTTTSRYNSSNLVLPPGRFTIGFNLYRRFLK